MINSGKVINILEFVDVDNCSEISTLAGREYGKLQRGNHNLEELDCNDDVITVNIPKNIIFMSSSFFLGMFGESVRKRRDELSFKEKYVFKCSENVNKNIDNGIFDALNTESALHHE